MTRVLSLVLALAPQAASACSVCFGDSKDNKGFVDGLWWGIVLLILVTMSMLGGIGWAFWSVEKRRRAAEAEG